MEKRIKNDLEFKFLKFSYKAGIMPPPIIFRKWKLG
jgi:hypothetical protein